jgi:hypothetical protein
MHGQQNIKIWVFIVPLYSRNILAVNYQTPEIHYLQAEMCKVNPDLKLNLRVSVFS